MIKKISKSIISILLVMGMVSAISCFGKSDKSAWIWKAGGKKYTINDLEAAYGAYLTQVSEQLRVSVEELKKLIKDPELAARKTKNPQYREIFRKLQKKEFITQYKQMILVNLEANTSKYVRSKEFKKQLNFNKINFISTMYIKHITKVKDPTRAECVTFFEKLRNKDKRFMTVPIDPDGINIAKQQLKMRKLQEKQQSEMQRIALEQKIVSNKKFNMDEYLEKENKTEEKKKSKKENKK